MSKPTKKAVEQAVLDPVRSVRIERAADLEDDDEERYYFIVDDIRPVAWAGRALHHIRLPQRVIDAIKERC